MATLRFGARRRLRFGHVLASCAKISAAILLLVLSGCTSGQADVVQRARAGEPNMAEKAKGGPGAEEVARSYSRLRLMTQEPVLVDPQLAMLWVGIWEQHVEHSQKRTGPHAHTSIRIFMNESAAQAFCGSTEYPVGSVIVKEKQGLEYRVGDPSSESLAKTSDGIGGMIKRSAGYDPDHGNWEYFYFEDAAKIEHGRIASCIECHRGAASSDYVFGSWAGRD